MLVGRRFHPEGAEALLSFAREGVEVKIALSVARELNNRFDANAMLVSCEGLACGHLPREHAAALAPLVDGGLVQLEAEADARSLAELAPNAPVPLRVHVQLVGKGLEEAAAILRRVAVVSRLAVAATARPLKEDARAPKKQKLQGGAAQRSLLMNFGCGTSPSACEAGSARGASFLGASIAGAGVLPRVARHLSIAATAAVNTVNKDWRAAAAGLLERAKHRAALEAFVRGHGWAPAAPSAPSAGGREEAPQPGDAAAALGVVKGWAPGRLGLEEALEAAASLGEEDGRWARALANERLGLGPSDGWPALAAMLLVAPSGKRMGLLRAAVARRGVELDDLRELVALLVAQLLGGRLGRGARAENVGARRLLADLLVCNRVLEDAGLKLPLRGLRVPGLQLTEEQVGIVARDVRPTEILIISAFAGTGKTSTLRMYATLRPHLLFLYICFNVSVREEAQRTFPSNVTCRNAHQLAFAACGFKYRHKLKEDLRAEDLLGTQALTALAQRCRLRRGGASEETASKLEAAEACLAMLQNFLNSAAETVGAEHVPCPLPRIVRDGLLPEEALCEAVQELWARMQDFRDDEVRMTHGGYLKLYSLSKPQLPCDVVMLDEAQDCNPAIADIVMSQSCARLLVGDKHQAIYGFLGAQDALSAGAAGAGSQGRDTIFRRQLTRCFRFGPNIADVANFVLSSLKGEPRPLIGCGKHEGELLRASPEPPFAFVARTNAEVINMALAVDAGGGELVWVGGVRGYGLGLLRDLCFLAMGQRERAESARVRSFASLDALRAFARRVDDREAVARIELVRRHDPEQLLGRLERLQAAAERRERAAGTAAVAVANRGRAVVSLATVHKAKGLEWDTVVVSDGFSSPEDIAREMQEGLGGSSLLLAQEINALYVALTRAKRSLQLPRSLAEAYLKEAEAVALVQPRAASSGPCPSCGFEVAEPSRRLFGLEAQEPGLVAAGSVSLCRLCGACSALAGPCRLGEQQPAAGGGAERGRSAAAAVGGGGGA